MGKVKYDDLSVCLSVYTFLMLWDDDLGMQSCDPMTSLCISCKQLFNSSMKVNCQFNLLLVCWMITTHLLLSHLK